MTNDVRKFFIFYVFWKVQGLKGWRTGDGLRVRGSVCRERETSDPRPVWLEITVRLGLFTVDRLLETGTTRKHTSQDSGLWVYGPNKNSKSGKGVHSEPSEKTGGVYFVKVDDVRIFNNTK